MRTSTAVRLIATDLDGTLLRDDKTVSERTRRALMLAHEAGISLALVTARPPRFVRRLADDMGLTCAAICCNGAIIYDLATDDLLEHSPLPSTDATRLVTGLRETAPGVTFAVEIGLRYGCEPEYLALGSLSEPQGELLADALHLCASPVTKLIARHPSRTAPELTPLVQTLAGASAEATYSSERFVEISAPGIDKARTLARHCERLGIAPAEVIAFGDMPNDVRMLRWAGRGVAVASAHAEALAAADEVTASNMEDGVAQAIEALLA